MKPKYLRASKKQLAYIDSMCQQLGVVNKTLYTKYSLDDAAKMINSLKRKLDKQKLSDKQLKLL